MHVIATRAPKWSAAKYDGKRPPIPWIAVASAMANNVPFRNTTGSMRGTVGGTSYGGADWKFSTEAQKGGNVWTEQLYCADYVVWSYATPIAWRNGLRWTVPEIKYSVTTSQHQGLVQAAVYSLEPQGDVYAR